MSASKNKKMRMEAKNAPDAAKTPMSEQEKEKRKYKITVTVVSIVLVLFILVVVFLSSTFMYNQLPSVKIGDESFTACDYAFYYNVVYTNYYNTLSSYYGSSIDTSMMPSGEQLEPDVLNLMQSTAVLHHEAEAAGYTLSEENQDLIESYMSSAASSAEQYAGGDMSAYLSSYFCKGMTEDVYRNCVEYYVYASAYGTETYDSFTYTKDALDAYYSEHADEYDKFTYDWFLFDNDDYDGEALEQANAFLDELKAGGVFSEVAYKYATDEKKENYDSGSTTTSTLSGSSLSDTFSSWLVDASRKAGDCEVFETDTGAYVLQFQSRDDNNYNLVSFRHILIKPETVAEGDYETDEAYQQALDEANSTAKEEADIYYALWQEDPTEDNFSQMAQEYSEDSSSSNGGLFEDVYKGQMVTPINDWIFAEERKSGDTAIVESDYGYHIVYFVGESDTRYCDTLAENSKRSEDYENWLNACMGDGYEVSTNLIFKLTEKKA